MKTKEFVFHFTRGQFWPSGIVVACVWVSGCQTVCQSLACPRDNSGPIQARITTLRPNVQNNLVSLLFCGTIDLDLRGQI